MGGVMVGLETFSSCSDHFKVGWNDLGIGITFSSDSGTLPSFFKCYFISLIWSRPRWTCFAVAVNNPIRDITCQTRQVGLESRFCIFAFNVCQCPKGGSDLALLDVKLVTYKVKKLVWGPVLVFPCSPSNLIPDTELLEFVCAGDRFGVIWF